MSEPALPFSPAADRNKGPLLEVLRGVLPAAARVLEVASGTGQHAAHFAAAERGWQWQPTDLDDAGLQAIDRRCASLANVRRALRLDVLAQPWPAALGSVDAVYCANMLHISPWTTCPALMQGAARHLNPGGCLVLYGPYWVDGETPAPSNVAFDADLRARNPAWGLRRLADVVREAAEAGLAFERRIDMPAHNLSLLFRQR